MKLKTNHDPSLISTLAILLAVGVGLVIGLVVNNVPYFTLDKSVDAGTIISIIALFIATIVVPFKINSHIANRRNINTIIVADLDDLLDLLDGIRGLLDEVCNSKKAVTIQHKKIMMSRFRQANNQLTLLKGQFKTHFKGIKFTDKVMLPFSQKVYPAYTDDFQQKRKISDATCLRATLEMDKVISNLKKIRYQIYT